MAWRAVLVLVLLGSSLPASADPWPRGRGHWFVHSSLASFEADELFDTSGRTRPFPGRDTEERRVGLYVEAGLTDSVTVVLNAPWKKITTRGNVSTFESSGVADVDLRLRQSFRVGEGWFAIEGGAFIPAGYEETEFPQLGTGETDWILNLSYGRSLEALPEGFVSVDAGYRWRDGGLADEIPYTLKVGAFPFERAGLFLFARGWESRADWSSIVSDFGFRASDSERLAGGAEIYVGLTRSFDLNLVWTEVLDGRNTGAGREWSAGIAWHR